MLKFVTKFPVCSLSSRTFCISIRSMSTISHNLVMENTKAPTIGTHSGHFHADEALAVWMLKRLPAYQASAVIRTRNQEELKSCNIVVDVGGVYDANLKRFDHHQRGFNVTFPGFKTKLSAAGLVYMHYGKEIIGQICGMSNPEKSEDVQLLHVKMYQKMIEAFDANDNGISLYDDAALTKGGYEQRYDNSGYSIAAVVAEYYFQYQRESIGLVAAKSKLAEDAKFNHASSFVGEFFLMTLQNLHTSWLASRAIVRSAFANRFTDVHQSGRIMKLEYRAEGLVWVDHLYEAENDESTDGKAEVPKVWYVLFPETGEKTSKWRVRAVNTAIGSFSNRKDLPDEWKGLRDTELDKVSGIDGCVFVHASGFIGGNASYEGALEMAIKAVENKV